VREQPGHQHQRVVAAPQFDVRDGAVVHLGITDRRRCTRRLACVAPRGGHRRQRGRADGFQRRRRGYAELVLQVLHAAGIGRRHGGRVAGLAQRPHQEGLYARAEAQGQRCVELEPGDAWGQHAVAHVMEMQGRRRDGIAWMRANPQARSDGNFFAVHNWWHVALFHLGLDEMDEGLALYDGPIDGARSPWC
jgi:hypothetical protein